MIWYWKWILFMAVIYNQRDKRLYPALLLQSNYWNWKAILSSLSSSYSLKILSDQIINYAPVRKFNKYIDPMSNGQSILRIHTTN